MLVPRDNILQPHLTPDDNQLNRSRTMIRSEWGTTLAAYAYSCIQKRDSRGVKTGDMAIHLDLGIAAWRLCFCFLRAFPF